MQFETETILLKDDTSALLHSLRVEDDEALVAERLDAYKQKGGMLLKKCIMIRKLDD